MFAPYYSATLVAVLVGGMGAGFLAAGLGGIAAYWLFVLPERRVSPDAAQQLTSLALYAISSAETADGARFIAMPLHTA